MQRVFFMKLKELSSRGEHFFGNAETCFKSGDCVSAGRLFVEKLNYDFMSINLFVDLRGLVILK